MSTPNDVTSDRESKLHTLTAEALSADKAALAAHTKARAAKTRLKAAKKLLKAAKSEVKRAKKAARKAARRAKHSKTALQRCIHRAEKLRKSSRRLSLNHGRGETGAKGASSGGRKRTAA